MKKRKDECLICKSRNCYSRIVREESPYYDEVACTRHNIEMGKHSDITLGKGNGIYRHYISSTGKLKRGEKIDF